MSAPKPITNPDVIDRIDALLRAAQKEAQDAWGEWPLVMGAQRQVEAMKAARMARDLLAEAVDAYEAACPAAPAPTP